MHPTKVIRILNDVLKRISPSIKLSTDVEEDQIERHLAGMLRTFDKLKEYKRAKKHRKDYPMKASFSLGESQRPGPAGGGRVKSFVSSLTAAGVSPQKALGQAVRLGVGGGTNGR